MPSVAANHSRTPCDMIMEPSGERSPLSILPATRQDAGAILSFIRALAEYEKLADKVTATEADVEEALFGKRPVAEAVIARVGAEAAGFALFFHNYSTFVGRPGLYLEDVFVKPEMRGKGIGRALLVHVARIAVGRGCGRMEWAVLDWNRPAIEFYRRLGAEALDDWTVYRLSGARLAALAAEA